MWRGRPVEVGIPSSNYLSEGYVIVDWNVQESRWYTPPQAHTITYFEDDVEVTGTHELAITRGKHTLVARKTGATLTGFRVVPKARVFPAGEKARREAEQNRERDERLQYVYEVADLAQAKLRFAIEVFGIEAVTESFGAAFYLEDFLEAPRIYSDGSFSQRVPHLDKVEILFTLAQAVSGVPATVDEDDEEKISELTETYSL
jgi:hypothetical protein